MKDFMFTLLAWLLTLPMIIAAVAFALYNSDPVSVTINPFYPPLELPYYVPVLAGIAFGFVFGCLMTWAAGGRIRRERREQKKKIRTLETKLAEQGHPAKPAAARHNYSLIPTRLIRKTYP